MNAWNSIENQLRKWTRDVEPKHEISGLKCPAIGGDKHVGQFQQQ
jgi:hypothetical protein